ncbi:hypothetical protein A3C89_03545 [Candidatus Kaiserbacteria bacterium RIFCSPHIGHO2_02_FULL_50_50]|uniref:Uncharacterized protein n=1 Tax=Candidatus Kaiserbacteria bacterium RIFCSPHIGHO2_02_FULL_50_50 TaxID=1798492 RepID=A0A1F6DBY6_9BACT|nr:MAG: hypothetical protein A3C89_03545 [Candidatus Kaiserbacteria bacterium RIFCSPHIGHO2_02_FULL_50_50]OGG88535.1 MAG: hypothetical protein A3G62_03435 [Candidatus Kaiserbacteria bacterium RIFCSPLOWO2_12_FULL_50_10]
METCKPVTEVSELIDGETYISVYLINEKLSISYLKMLGQPFPHPFSRGGDSLFVKFEDILRTPTYSFERALKDLNIPAVRNHYNQNRLFLFTASNNDFLRGIDERCDASAYRALISLA